MTELQLRIDFDSAFSFALISQFLFYRFYILFLFFSFLNFILSLFLIVPFFTIYFLFSYIYSHYFLTFFSCFSSMFSTFFSHCYLSILYISFVFSFYIYNLFSAFVLLLDDFSMSETSSRIISSCLFFHSFWFVLRHFAIPFMHILTLKSPSSQAVLV